MPIKGGNLKYMKGGYTDGRFRVHHFSCRLLGGKARYRLLIL